MANASSTADEILECARNLIVAGGYNGFSYADIAEVVGIRKPSIHHHFPSKVDLVRTLVSRYRDEVEAGIAGLERQSSDPLEMLQNYTGFWERCISDGSRPFCVCALLAGELPALPDEVALEVKAHFRSLSGWLTSVFERGAKQGRIRLAHSPRVEAEVFMATVHGAMLTARAYGDAKAFAVVIQPLVSRLTNPT